MTVLSFLTAASGRMLPCLASYLLWNEKDKHNDIPPLHPANLTVFEYVREITGNLIIQSSHEDFKNLSCFKSLEYIYGRETNSELSLSIIMTKLESLELMNLKQIRRGSVMIAGNTQLCYINSINWSKLLSTNQQKTTISHNKNTSLCMAENRVCDPECSSDGCWGPGSEKCLSCKRYRIEEKNVCIKSCAHIELHYEGDNMICKPCHEECRNNCTGPEPSECDSCINVSIIDSTNHTICLAECPEIMYPDKNSVCQKCHKNCANGCTGPMDHVGENGCNSCEVGYRQMKGSSTIKCMPTDTDNCPDGHHMKPVKFDIIDPLAGKRICEPCHRFCKTCTGAGVYYCNLCRYYFQQSTCVEHCHTMSYGNNDTKMCDTCHTECRSGCRGPDSSDCLACKNFKIYTNEETTKVNSTSFLIFSVHNTQNTQQVKITDFGLAKLLDYDEEVYQAAGGKMPIKWLALECIQHRIFTHKSDVWSYGVTVWELMTYGLKPYDSIRARDVPDLLEKGERLPQPHCCTIDVYMIMIKCWMLDAESRPSFKELQEEFAKMARDPGRYLVIPGRDNLFLEVLAHVRFYSRFEYSWWETFAAN
ncbi:hypothetical protein LOTGIDRAFT_176100 [Lottia gigantea]|uniref:Protein kinase domain-containing protein n=1 Tax=Lottia gigantea TaxID=225164 RepID=V4B7Z3_LOTGI|nr:hypothetical protein LOTGIDRAFT_176100 [Lottia gigantea]ESO84799.1 hypothetical protein LOTGIDRAFT_176100 [Lottia gigantea]